MDMPKMRKVPDAAFKWAEKLFRNKGYLHYKRNGRYATVFCTACGKTFAGAVIPGETYEEVMTEVVIDKPVHGTEGTCVYCKTKALYRSVGMIRNPQEDGECWTIGQRIGEDFVFRSFKTWQITKKMQKTEYIHSEYARSILRKGKKPEHGYWYESYCGTGWYSNNSLYGSINISRQIWPGTMKEISDTQMLKYGNTDGYDPIDYYEAFSRYPDMEMIQKAGMDRLMRLLMCQRGANINPRGKTPWDRLRIYKDRMPMLRESRGETMVLQILQQERKEKKHFTDAEIKKERYIHNAWDIRTQNTLREVLKHTTLAKLEKYLEEQGRKSLPRDTYLDYIRMRMRAGYDLDNQIILFPKDLRRRHNEMVRELEAEAIDKRKKETNEKFKGIAKLYNKLDKKYGADLGEYIIRPARDAAEIVEEGRTLHHCVGGDNYLSGHDKGTSIILFLRKKEEQETPYCTIEIKGNKILQWYEAYDRKPDEEILQPLLDAYTANLKKEKKNGRSRDHIQAIV